MWYHGSVSRLPHNCFYLKIFKVFPGLHIIQFRFVRILVDYILWQFWQTLTWSYWVLKLEILSWSCWMLQLFILIISTFFTWKIIQRPHLHCVYSLSLFNHQWRFINCQRALYQNTFVHLLIILVITILKGRCLIIYKIWFTWNLVKLLFLPNFFHKMVLSVKGPELSIRILIILVLVNTIDLRKVQSGHLWRVNTVRIHVLIIEVLNLSPLCVLSTDPHELIKFKLFVLRFHFH